MSPEIGLKTLRSNGGAVTPTGWETIPSINSIDFRPLAHTIVTAVCEGVSDCVDACPVACIHPGRGANIKGTNFYWIDFETCIDCGICLQVCPVSGAILAGEKPELQQCD